MKYLVIPCMLASTVFAQDFKLPPPFATPSVRNQSMVIARPAGAQLKVPAGFTVEEYLSGFERPRTMILGPSKELLITDTVGDGKGAVYIVNNPGQSKEKRKLIDGLDRPFGLAFWKDYLYVGEPTSIKRYKYDAKAMTAGPGQQVVPLTGFGKGPKTRFLPFDPKGERMCAGAGSESNRKTGDGPLPRAATPLE